MIPPALTAAVADQRRADLRAWAHACCAPVRRVAAPPLARLVERLRADARRLQLGPADTACATC